MDVKCNWLQAVKGEVKQLSMEGIKECLKGDKLQVVVVSEHTLGCDNARFYVEKVLNELGLAEAVIKMSHSKLELYSGLTFYFVTQSSECAGLQFDMAFVA